MLSLLSFLSHPLSLLGKGMFSRIPLECSVSAPDFTGQLFPTSFWHATGLYDTESVILANFSARCSQKDYNQCLRMLVTSSFFYHYTGFCLMHCSLQRAVLKYIMIIHSWQLSLEVGCSFLHLEFGSQSSKVAVTHPINGRVDFPLHQSILLTLYQCAVTHPYFHQLSMPCPVWSWTPLSQIQSTFPL